MQKINLIIMFILGIMLVACSTTSTDMSPLYSNLNIDPTDLNQLCSAKAPGDCGNNAQQSAAPQQLSQLRVKSLEDTALTIAAQGSLAWASRKLNCQLAADRWYLDTIYNFNGMMLTHGVIPPVLVEGDNSLNLADPDTIRVADKTYKIIAQARFATTPPNWREYLWMAYPCPEMPHRVLLPRTPEESKIWCCAVKRGWDQGIKQAYDIFQQNLARLKRDYNGMILYRKLLAQKMVSPPFVSRTELGVTGDGTDMRINDQVLRITELPKLQTNSQCWKAIVVNKNDNS